MKKSVITKAHNLVEARKSYEALQLARKKLQEEILSNPDYQELLEQEKRLGEEYQVARDEFTSLVKTEEIDDRVEVDNGYISVSPKRDVVISDEDKLEKYLVSTGQDLNQFVKKSWKNTDVKKFVLEHHALGEDVEGTDVVNDISISVNYAK